MDDILLDNFFKEINDTTEYIKHIKLVNDIEKKNRDSDISSIKLFNEHFKKFHNDKKLFEHKAVLINLYGILESTITIWIKEHISNISFLIKDYNELSDNFKDVHFDLSINLINAIKPNTKYEDLDKKDILNKLNHAIINSSAYVLNSEAYIPSSGNLKYVKIVEAFKNLDIDLEKKLKNRISDNEVKQIVNNIDILVSLRNDIAHGNRIENRLDVTEFKQYVEVLEKLGRLLFDILIEKEIEYECIGKYDKIEDVIDTHYDIGLEFNIENQEIRKGDFVIIKDSENKYFKKEILDIDLYLKSYDHIIVKSKSNVYVELKKKIKNNQTFYIRINEDKKFKPSFNLIKTESQLKDYYLI